ncbi:Formin-like protein 13 [Vitis vinifera]|uniref:Formin-like protein 13 n=1 Tax=Vitis vinifera TaxID=29760 RepID=A0A438GN03_VITVI|nr:Formin-like protein 13 [Vitis vinifera]
MGSVVPRPEVWVPMESPKGLAMEVFDCCFTTDAWEEENYKVYIRGIVGQLRDHIPDASILVFNFHEGEGQARLLTFLKAGSHLRPNNLLLMHCERGGWPILAFMLAALLIYRKHYTGEQKNSGDDLQAVSLRAFTVSVSTESSSFSNEVSTVYLKEKYGIRMASIG